MSLAENVLLMVFQMYLVEGVCSRVDLFVVIFCILTSGNGIFKVFILYATSTPNIDVFVYECNWLLISACSSIRTQACTQTVTHKYKTIEPHTPI